MHKEGGKNWGAEPAKPDAKETPKPADAPKPDAPKPGEEPAPDTTPPADITPEQKKQNPWKLYRQEKDRATKLEQQIEEVKKGALPQKEREEFQEKLTKTEQRLKEYEDEIRFKSYEKSDEFRTKFEQPYEEAWNRHWSDLQEVTITGDDGTPRAVAHQDILDLVNLSLPDARKLATEKWGDFAGDAMTARKEIRTLFEAKAKALQEARKTGAEREKQFQEKAKAWRDGVQKNIRETWDDAHAEALAHPTNGEFFKPVEGDDERNTKLDKGYKFVDEAFSKSPTDPNLSDEDRAKIVRQQAAVRNRAASFGMMKLLVTRLRAENEQLKKENSQFKDSQPPAGGGTGPNGAPPSGGSARDRMHAAGDKFARR